MKKPYLLFVGAVSLMLVGAGCENTDEVGRLNRENSELKTQLAQQQKPNDLELQAKCSDMAKNYFVGRGYKDGDGFTFDYINHFNAKLNKCFIQISSYSPNDDARFIDVYDAVEGKHYASYNGHNICDPAILAMTNTNLNKCRVDSGNIWLDGNDTKSPPDIQVGFQGLLNGPGEGDKDTQKQFLARIQSFMSE